MEGLRRRLEEVARAAGLDLLGVAAVDPFPEVAEEMRRRQAGGQAQGLGFTYRDPDTATDPRLSNPWAESMIVGGRSYLPGAGSPSPVPGSGRVARIAVEDSYTPLRQALWAVADALHGVGYRAEVLCDDSRLVDRAAAWRAGLGWWGKNSMVLAPRFGPWLLFGSVITDARLEFDRPLARDCGSCSACLPACPTGALVAPGVLDARLCLAAWAQAPGSIPDDLRIAMDDRIYGCDDCLDACPPGHRLVKRSSALRGMIDLEDILTAADVVLLERFHHWFLPGRDPDIIRRNALIAAGNSGRANMSRMVAPYVAHPNPVLVEHALWALGRLGGMVADAVLQSPLASGK